MEEGNLAYQFFANAIKIDAANIPKMTVIHTLQTCCNDATTDDKDVKHTVQYNSMQIYTGSIVHVTHRQSFNNSTLPSRAGCSNLFQEARKEE